MRDPAVRVFGSGHYKPIGASAFPIEEFAFPPPTSLVPTVANQLAINMYYNPVSQNMETSRIMLQTLGIIAGIVVAPYVAAVMTTLFAIQATVAVVTIVRDIRTYWGDDIANFIQSLFGPAAKDLEYVYAGLLPMMAEKLADVFMSSKITDLGQDSPLNNLLVSVQNDSRTVGSVLPVTDEEIEEYENNKPTADPLFLENMILFTRDNSELNEWATNTSEVAKVSMALRVGMDAFETESEKKTWLLAMSGFLDRSDGNKAVSFVGGVYKKENCETAIASILEVVNVIISVSDKSLVLLDSINKELAGIPHEEKKARLLTEESTATVRMDANGPEGFTSSGTELYGEYYTDGDIRSAFSRAHSELDEFLFSLEAENYVAYKKYASGNWTTPLTYDHPYPYYIDALEEEALAVRREGIDSQDD